MNYKISSKDKITYVSLVLLNEMIQFQHYFPVNLDGPDVFLQEYLQHMHQKGAIRIQDGNYVPTELGREEIVKLYEKYYEYLKIYDIFCAVDLEAGEFAFSRISDEMDDVEWSNFISNERFSDVRVAVADFKGINPIEMVFLSFLNENRFDCTVDKWQHYLTVDTLWNEIEVICNSAVSVEYLKEDGVLEDVIIQGTEIAIGLIKLAQEQELVEEPVYEDEEEIIETTTVVEEYVDIVEEPYYPYSYWDSYYDPYYYSPIWVAAAICLY